MVSTMQSRSQPGSLPQELTEKGSDAHYMLCVVPAIQPYKHCGCGYVRAQLTLKRRCFAVIVNSA